MSVRNQVLNAAMIGLTLGTMTAASTPAHAEDKAEEKCFGINACASHAKCGVSKSDIEATKETFKDKFAKSVTHDCAGLGKCGADKGQLGWQKVAKGTCLTSGGFLIESKNGKKVVVKS